MYVNRKDMTKYMEADMIYLQHKLKCKELHFI